MEITECSKTKQELIDMYNNLDEEARKLLEASYSTVSDTKACENRVEELKVFCKKAGFNKLGIAVCKGLKEYGAKLDEELSRDFEVYFVCCNLCGINKSDIKVKQLKEGEEEIACNPIGQAVALNDKNVDLVIKCGFCLGHDMLFSKHINTLTTTLLIKDRKLKHKTIDAFN